MLSVTFGTRTGSVADPLVKRILPLGNEFMELTGVTYSLVVAPINDTTSAGPWTNAIDFIKPLQWIPTRIRRRGRRLHRDFLEVYGALILLVKERMESGENVPDCLVKSILEYQENEKLSWADMCLLTTAFATGGSHSVSHIFLLNRRLLTKLCRPQVQFCGSLQSCRPIQVYRPQRTRSWTGS